MCEVVEISDDEDTSVVENSVKCVPIDDDGLKCDVPPQFTCLKLAEDDVPCSSGSNWRSVFAGMGFKQSLIDKVIEEKGEGNADMLLEALLEYSNEQKMKEELCDDALPIGRTIGFTAIPDSMESLDKGKSSESLDSLLGKKKSYHGEKPSVKEEPSVPSGDMDEKILSMLRMNFSLDEVGAAMERLGKHASTSQLMDFIFAARMAQKYKKEPNSKPGNEESEKDLSSEALFSIMDNTLQLLDMGFSESQISTAFEICGSEASLLELTNSIVAPETVVKVEKSCTSPNVPMAHHFSSQPFEYCVKTEGYESVVGNSESVEKSKGKMATEYCIFDEPNPKKPKTELLEDSYIDDTIALEDQKNFGLSSKQIFWRQIDSYIEADRKPILLPKPARNLTSLVAKRPYFLFGSTTGLPQITWTKVSQFLYSIQPECIDTRPYSSLSRIEGYIHNLPTEDRFPIFPKGPMSLEEAIPSVRKWKPSWDTSTHITLTDCNPSGVSHLCDKLGKLLDECEGHPLPDQKRLLLQHIESKNLIWAGNYKLSPLDPEHLERIMGYPLHHSQVSGFTSSERVKSLKLSFQTDALGYHISVLKRLFPEGVSLLSFFTGMGGAEISLHRLGIRLKGLVSIEPNEVNRRVMKKWWENSGQTGKFVQMESIQKLSITKLESLSKSLSGFDFVICQNPSDDSTALDFSQFMEFVRVFQRLRSSSMYRSS